jgi:hypothetical protein
MSASTLLGLFVRSKLIEMIGVAPVAPPSSTGCKDDTR